MPNIFGTKFIGRLKGIQQSKQAQHPCFSQAEARPDSSRGQVSGNERVCEEGRKNSPCRCSFAALRLVFLTSHLPSHALASATRFGGARSQPPIRIQHQNTLTRHTFFGFCGSHHSDMSNHSRVSLAGRLIITAIFALTFFFPEILLMVLVAPRSQRAYPLLLALFRITLGVVLYYFTMLGYGGARWITAFLLIMSTAMAICVSGKHTPTYAIVFAIFLIPSIVILLAAKIVRPEDRLRSRRRRVNS